MEGHDILTVADVATWLRVHPSTVYRLLAKHQLPAFRIGTDWRFNREQLNRWVDQQLIDWAKEASK